MHIADIPGLSKLSTAEKILLLEDLWDSISAEESAIPVPGSHKTELDRRMAKAKSSPGSLLTLDELKTRIDKRK